MALLDGACATPAGEHAGVVRPYICGPRCDAHAPWALAGLPSPVRSDYVPRPLPPIREPVPRVKRSGAPVKPKPPRDWRDGDASTWIDKL